MAGGRGHRRQHGKVATRFCGLLKLRRVVAGGGQPQGLRHRALCGRCEHAPRQVHSSGAEFRSEGRITVKQERDAVVAGARERAFGEASVGRRLERRAAQPG
jgi:hypothetical protein